MEAVARKVSTSPSIDFGELATATKGFSGADLQAVIYNAHLEAVHASIASSTQDPMTSREEEPPIEYMAFGGPETSDVATKAEKMALQKKVGLAITSTVFYKISLQLRQIRSASQPTRTTVQKASTAPTKASPSLNVRAHI